MSRLCELSNNGQLKDMLDCIVANIEEQAQCTVARFNIVLEDECGHCVTTYGKEKEKKVCK